MASEAKILEAIFGPSIPTEKAAVLPEIMGHIRAIEDLLQGVPRRQAHPRITDPAISGPINSRILELSAEHGKSWPKIAAAICQEFGVSISPDACRGRYKDAMERKTAVTMQQEAYAALSGEAIQAGTYTTPPEVLQLATKEKPAEPAVDPTPGEQAGPDDRQIGAIKAEAIKRYNAGEDVKAIADSLGVQWRWVRAVCAKAPKPKQEDKAGLPSEKAPPPEPPAESLAQSAIIQERPTSQAISRAELDAKIWALHKAGQTPEEISDKLYGEGLYYSAKSVRVRLISQGAGL